MDSCTKLMMLMVVFMVAGVVVICGHAIHLDNPDYNDLTTPQPETPKGGFPLQTFFSTIKVQAMAFSFHDKRGTNIVLSDGNKTATFQGNSFGNGIVMSSEPMEINKLYEVTIMKTQDNPKDKRGVPSLVMGVVTSSPDNVEDFARAQDWPRARLIVNGPGTFLHDLRSGARVGLKLDGNRNLRFYDNGAFIEEEAPMQLPDPCWAMWELNCIFYKATNPTVRDLP